MPTAKYKPHIPGFPQCDNKMRSYFFFITKLWREIGNYCLVWYSYCLEDITIVILFWLQLEKVVCSTLLPLLLKTSLNKVSTFWLEFTGALRIMKGRWNTENNFKSLFVCLVPLNLRVLWNVISSERPSQISS